MSLSPRQSKRPRISEIATSVSPYEASSSVISELVNKIGSNSTIGILSIKRDLEATKAEAEREKSLRKLERTNAEQTESRLKRHIALLQEEADEVRALLNRIRTQSDSDLEKMSKRCSEALVNLGDCERRLYLAQQQQDVGKDTKNSQREQFWKSEMSSMEEEIVKLMDALKNAEKRASMAEERVTEEERSTRSLKSKLEEADGKLLFLTKAKDDAIKSQQRAANLEFELKVLRNEQEISRATEYRWRTYQHNTNMVPREVSPTSSMKDMWQMNPRTESCREVKPSTQPNCSGATTEFPSVLHQARSLRQASIVSDKEQDDNLSPLAEAARLRMANTDNSMSKQVHGTGQSIPNRSSPSNLSLKQVRNAPDDPAIWSFEDDGKLVELMKKFKKPETANWGQIASEHGGTKIAKECHDRWMRYLKPGVRKGQWQEYEDSIILEAVTRGEQPFTRWSDIAQRLPGRVGKQIRERWANHLNPQIKHTPFTKDDDLLLYRAHSEVGKKWVEISTKYFSSSRSENHVKNRWYSASFKKFISNEFGPDAYSSPPQKTTV